MTLSNLQPGKNYTIFAFTNDAFRNSNVDFDAFPDKATSLGEYHIVEGQQSLLSSVNLTTLAGIPINVDVSSRGLLINGYANVIPLTPIQACNGLIYTIDHVLIEPCFQNDSPFPALITLATQNPKLSGLGSAVISAGRDYINFVANIVFPQQITLFAPSNEAWKEANLSPTMTDQQIQMILNYHIINNARIAATDIGLSANVTTLNGDNLVITSSLTGTDIKVGPGKASVIEANIQACKMPDISCEGF